MEPVRTACDAACWIRARSLAKRGCSDVDVNRKASNQLTQSKRDHLAFSDERKKRPKASAKTEHDVGQRVPTGRVCTMRSVAADGVTGGREERGGGGAREAAEPISRAVRGRWGLTRHVSGRAS